jgi:acyl carrier protein
MTDAADPLADDTGARVRAILAEHAMLEPEEVAPDATLQAIGMDSLGLMESIFAIEEAFDIQVPFNANAPGELEFDVSSVASIAEAVRRLRAAQV